MNYKPLIIVMGEPYSIFLEIFLKSYKTFIKTKMKIPVILIGSKNQLVKQMNFFKYKFKVRLLDLNFNLHDLNNNEINIINIDLNSKKTFVKNYKHSNLYIEKCFVTAINLLTKKKASGIINGPVSKAKFLKKKFAGITEYISHKTRCKNTSMLIFNEQLSVSPLTTHLPLKKVTRKITKEKIIEKVLLLNDFYKKVIKNKAKIAVMGLNPHCETTDKFSEENKIISPAIKKLKSMRININGPFSADTFFLRGNYKNFNLVLGMYHDQVLTPIKTLFDFNAINITVGLPFLRITPDHGPNEKMVKKNLSNPLSLIKSLVFFRKYYENNS